MNIIPNPDRDRQKRLDDQQITVAIEQRKIVKEDGKWCVKSKKGKSLGCYDTKKKALERLRQVEHFKDK